MKKLIIAVFLIFGSLNLHAETPPADNTHAGTPSAAVPVTQPAVPVQPKTSKLFEYVSVCLAGRPTQNPIDLLSRVK